MGWREAESGEFSVKAAYASAIKNWREELGEGGESSDPRRKVHFWRKIWKARIPARIKLLAWRFFHDGLPDEKNLRKRGCVMESGFVFCGWLEETALHLIRDCRISKWLAERLGIRFMAHGREAGKAADWLFMCEEHMDSREFTMTLCTLWVIWSCRNERCHGKEGWSAEEMLQKVQSLMHQSVLLNGGRDDKFWARVELRLKGDEGRLVFSYGSWRKNEVRAGWSVVLKEDGLVQEVRAGLNERLRSGMDAEGEAMRRGMEMVGVYGRSSVTFVSDSLDVVWAIFSGGAGKKGEGGWLDACTNFLKKNRGWRLVHLPREDNELADFWCRKARLDQWSWNVKGVIPMLS